MFVQIRMEDDVMNGIDMSIIKSKKGRIITSEEALRDVKPVDWSNDILKPVT